MPSILYIEPNRLLADTFASSLQAAGFVVDHCDNAQQAITHADKHTPDIVVAELQLASHSGMEFIYEFRSYPEWRNLSVVILSQVPLDDAGLTKQTLKELHISHYLYKPATSLKKLITVLKAELAVGSTQ